MSNNDSIEVSSATVAQAIADALAQLGAAEDDVVIEVLATPRSGLLGLGARDARVRVSRRAKVVATSAVTAPPPAPPPQRRDPPQAQRPQPPQPPPPRRESAPTSPPPAPKPEAVTTRPTQPPAGPRPPRPPREQQRSRPPRQERSQESESEDLSTAATIEEIGDADRRAANVDEQVQEASTILVQILELMNEKSEIRRGEGDRESLELEIRGDGSGILIGRHGQTLDALEYLLNRIVARRIKDAMPILLDTESYRARRRQQLHRMALSMGERAKREHAAVKLDPMPPRDRRIVHLALKDDPMITTRSAGEGFLRAVEIVPADGQRERRGGGRDNRRDRDRDREQERPREQDRGRDQERPRERERPAPAGQSTIGEQGGFKHGQKRLF
jgi:spoIIIJ-associated protein